MLLNTPHAAHAESYTEFRVNSSYDMMLRQLSNDFPVLATGRLINALSLRFIFANYNAKLCSQLQKMAKVKRIFSTNIFISIITAKQKVAA